MVRFLHLADSHLDTVIKQVSTADRTIREKIENVTFYSFEKLINTAINESVDFVIIAGDSFNTVQPSVKAQYFFVEQLNRLIKKGIQIVLCYGNHDYDENNRLIALPHQVHVFDKSVETFVLMTRQGEKVAFSGFSYSTRHVREKLIEAYPPRYSDVDFHIGVLHGQIGDAQGLYAPFTKQDLLAKNYDYWALGHVHKSQIIQELPPIVYSGSIQGLDRSEVDEKGGYLVTLLKNQSPILKFVATQYLLWVEIESEKRQEIDLIETLSDIQKQIKQHTLQSELLCVSVVIHTNDKRLYNENLKENIAAILDDPHILLAKVQLQWMRQTAPLSLNERVEKNWENVQNNPVDNEIYNEAMQSLFGNEVIAQLLVDLKEDKQLQLEITQAAIEKIQVALEGDM